ncbi:MCE family protein [Mycobacterium sp. CBMA293]|uniref:MCE family protein n=1 Tax=unclassified Mycolicibacterium TaxID=2636767 RepID=UPI0012DC9719|nr:MULTISPECIES: MCE family protein [unclassified Mycolicibacterium]MUL46315.1 MCE family protein [Mycolicibacterium sp. CBMA 360]MUL57173.1 MCE family protein [Mycolicibacterium sp. CBMA 335]MUL70213.1 MCE family protein [Mycolicibacterium sp. CBMA 311]MUL92261.1 MCE family protein [Mycolicibacterium sp. CBMA 230]MUM04807.1 mammalian cell entry protein [Mycolicibacterium sp. CBMA 213]
MTIPWRNRTVIAAGLVTVLVGGGIAAIRITDRIDTNTVVAYFENSNGVFPGDDVRVLGVRIGQVVKIEPQPQRAKVIFTVDRSVKIPADAKAAVLSPQLVTGRAIQLTPAYTSGPTMADGAVITQDRTAVPVEWDDLRDQLQRLTDLLKPTQPGGVSTLGAFVDTAANNLRGQGSSIRDTVIKLSQTLSTLGDHSSDIFATFKNLSTVVTALHDSSGALEQLNHNLAAVSSLLADNHDKVGQAVDDLSGVAADVQSFAADNREAIGTTSDKLASISNTIVASLDDIKQTLHVAPTTIGNFYNIYEPANGALTGVLAVNNFANPIGFLCGAIEAASRLNAEQSSKLCVQYLAPIVKNRQYNFPPLGFDPFVGPQARPNEVTYSEPWMRPDHVPSPSPQAPAAAASTAAPGGAPPILPAEASEPTHPADAAPTPSAATDPGAGLTGMMMPGRSGS